MGDYGENTMIGLDSPQLPLGLKKGASLFPLLTDGVISDEDQAAVPPVASGIDQTRITLTLRSETSATALASFCTRHGLTLLSVLNVAWSLVLSAYADLDVINVLFVSYVAGVPVIGLSEIPIDDEKTVQQALAEAEKQLSNSVAVPPATSVADLQRLSASDGHPTFNNVVLFSDSDTPEPVEAGDFVALLARATPNQFSIKLQAPAHIIPAAQLKNCAATLSHVIEEFIQHPNHPIAKISLMSPQGLEQISQWNQRVPEVVSHRLPELVDKTAQAQPDALAIDGADGRMTYGELQEYSNQLAHHLAGLGVGPEIAVPLFFEKSKWAIVTMIAVVKAGGVIVNLDAKQPKARLRELLARLQTPLVMTSAKNAGLWADEFPVVVVSEDAINQIPTAAEAPSTSITPRNALYIIFTSGSTGTPKGCVVEHESFLTAAAQHVKAASILPSSRVLQMTPYTFDVSMLEIFTTLTTGACICFCNDDEAARGISHIINLLQISWTFMTPSMARLVDPASVPSLETLALGGEGLSRIDVTTWADKLNLVNGYGPTECSVAATINVPLSLASDPSNIGIGYGAVCWVTNPDDHDRLVPPGAVGELVLQGPIVARGYLQEPEKTAAVFLDDMPAFGSLLPQSPPNFRLYKTGDLVRQNSDGTINFIGRKDRQVKLNGQRMELGEIEQRLSKDLKVQHALVLLPKEGPCKGRLVAVMSLHAFPYNGTRDTNVHTLSKEESQQARAFIPEITAQLATQLPAYMVPTFWVVLAALPFTTSGKVNGVAMTQWLRDMSEETYREISGVSDDLPEASLSTDIEFKMQQLWAEELGIPVGDVKTNRSFIALGGDSLTAMKVVARCRQQQLIISVPDVLRASNIVELAARVSVGSVEEGEGGHENESRSTPAQRIAALDETLLSAAGLTDRGQIEDTYNCSPMQAGILLSQVKFPGTYEIRRVLRVHSTRDAVTTISRLQDAWQAVVDRHQILRTVFVDAGGEFKQIVLNDVTARIHTFECLYADDEQAAIKCIQDLPPPTYHASQPQHALTICRAGDDGVFIKVEINHALVDGGSTQVILNELSLVFDAQPFPAPPALFSDYISFISKPHATDKSLKYWGDYLDGVQPTIVPMYPSEGKAKEIRSVSVPFRDVSKLLRFCEDHGVTLANVLQTAWALVLRAYTHTDDVCFGYVAAGRDIPVEGIEQAVGAFINMLVCRVQLNQQSSILDTIFSMQNEYFDALPHQHTSLAQIQHRLDLSGMALFNTIISVQKDVSDDPCGESLSFKPVEEDDPTDFDLAVAIHVGKEICKIDIGYWSTLLSEGDAANLANTFKGAISSILSHEQSTPTAIDLFTEEDRAQIFTWNQTEPTQAPGVVHDYVLAKAQEQPDAQAICAWDGEYTYAELVHLSEKLAHHLAQLGAGPEVLVPHCFPKSKLAAVSMLAIMMSGSASVGLSSAHPRARIQDIVESCSSEIAVVAQQNIPVVEGLIKNIVVVDEEFLDTLPSPPVNARLPQAKPCNPAFVSFTSGSTGKPKGIVLEHGSLITSILAHGPTWDVNKSARVLQFSAYSFDASMSDTYTTLVCGGTVCIPHEKDRVDDLAGAIKRLRVNWAFLTPRVLGLLSPEIVPGLKTVVLGGEAISKEDVAVWIDAISLRLVYGPTECTIYSTGTNPLTSKSEPASLGYPVGTRVWITSPDTTDQLMPVGCIGELVIEGPLVTRGYLNEPVKTKEAYFEDPVWLPKRSTGEPRRFYKTNDLVRYYPDGQLRFIGRKDTQVKIRGQRVELGEIEHAITASMPETKHITVDAVVLPPQTLVAFLHMDAPNAKKAQLFMPLDTKMQDQLRGLEHTLSNTLPIYMVPGLYIPITRVPMTISGKVDRIALRRAVSGLSPEQVEMYALTQKEKAAPQGPREERLRDIWAGVLNKDPSSVSRNDSFFRLGGDSIGAMKLVTAARPAGFVLSVANIFRHPVLSDMAECLELSGAGELVTYSPFSLSPGGITQTKFLADLAVQCSIPSDAIQDVYPATPLQEGVFMMSTTHKGAYVAPTAFRLPADFDVPRFKEAWQTLVNAHSILRTRLVTVDATNYQVVLNKSASSVEWEEADSLDGYLQRIQELQVASGMPLARYALLPEGDSTVFVWTAHHALFDGWSVGLILEQLAQFYKNAITPSLSTAYAEFVQFIQNSEKDSSLDFWESLVPQDPPSVFPRLPSSTYQPTAKATCWRTISATEPEGSNFTLAILLRAAWAIVLSRYTDSENILFGQTLSGRDVPVSGIENVVGPTITTVPMNVHLDGEMLVEAFLQQQQDRNVEMMHHQHAGLQAIRRISPAAAAASEFTNLFVVQPQADGADNLKLEKIPTDMTQFDPYALLVECNLADNEVILEARFDDSVLSMDQTHRLLGHFGHVLNQLTQLEPGHKLCDLDIFSAEDEQQIWEWNAMPARSENKCVHDLIAEQAMSSPNHVAIEAWDGSLTYSELDKMSSQLSHWLVANLNIKPEALVPLCFDKSLWTVVTMLAVVKCGGGCVMLNPDHPVSRLEGVISDTGSPVVLASPERMGLFASGTSTVVPISEEFIHSLPPVPRNSLALPTIQPTNPIFVIFTSGSSGKPKGIIVQHNSVCTVAIQHGNGLGFVTPGLRVLQFASFSFDVSMGEVFITLMKGGTLCIPTEYDRINHLSATINRMQISWTFMAPTVAALLDPQSVPGLKTLVLGGEAVSQSLVDQWASQVQLIDSYGPAETTIWSSHANPSATVSPANIGRGTGCRYWVVDTQDYNRLAPIGCVGELLIEGPNVSRGYLNEPEKTKAAFIENPAWLQGKETPQYKFYCTGDLVRYNPDGSLNISGRKDSQVKHHGQRIELGEIEFHLRARPEIEAGMVLLPKTGPCQNKLVAVVALTNLQPLAVEGDRVALIPGDLKARAQPEIQAVEDGLGEVLPPYMVPTTWIILDSIPLTASRKINRNPITRWVQAMSDAAYRSVMDVVAANVDEPTTQIEKQLAEVWSHVLNLPLETIGSNRSFLSLGGDSITAMQVVSRCRALSIELSVQDVLQPKSLAGVASRALAARPQAVVHEEEYDVPFELSPIQQLYFDQVVTGEGSQPHHYNQSVLLRVTRSISHAGLSKAIEHIVANHSMLRARFSKQDDGQWTQTVQSPTETSTPVASHRVENRWTVFELIQASQRQVDIEQGPIFVVDHFTLPDQGELLSLVAHHLVVDAVSWHIIIGQLEQLLVSPDTSLQSSLMPFQGWVKEQRQYSESLSTSSVLQTPLPEANLEYWDLEQLPTWSDGEEIEFTLDIETTALLLADANNALRTEPADLLVAALQHSFANSFPDRSMPTIFSEGHGREPWEASIDLSETIGWFTTFYPIHRRVRQNENFKYSVKRTKDARRAFKDNGFAYFTHRHYSDEGRKEFSHHNVMEICFNYLGQAQHTERADALLQQEPLLVGESPENIGDSMSRLAVFDVSAAVSQGRLTVSFFFNHDIGRQEKIRQWVQSCETVLQSAVKELTASDVEYSLSDFPLLQLDYQDLTTLTNATLPAIGYSPAAIEDMYPCSPIQEGILISQARQPGTYEVRQLFEVIPRADVGFVDVSRLLQAWQNVVDRHALLRTVFIESLAGPGVYDQLVLRSHTPEVKRLVYEGTEAGDVASFISQQPSPDYQQPVPAHRITICEFQEKVYCQLEVSHALIDGTSMALLVRDLVSAFENSLPVTPAPLYGDYMAYLATLSQTDALEYWTTRLADLNPCHFPSLHSSQTSDTSFQSKIIHIDADGRLQRFCESKNLTMSNLFQAAWGLVLRAYTGSSDVCFGYMTSGRDIPIEDIYEAIGPFINLLVCRLHVGDDVSVGDLLETVQSDYLSSLPHQQTSLASIQHSLGESEVALFNTILSLQREPAPGAPRQVEFEIVDQTDPTEYDVDLNITTGETAGVEIHITYRTSMLSDGQAENLLQTFTNILLAVATSSDKLISSLDISSPVPNALSRVIPQPTPLVVDASVSELIAENAERRPMSIAIQSAEGDVTFTYRDLDRMASALAGHLWDLAVQPGDVVPLSFPRSPWALVAMLAVLQAGAISLPLGPLDGEDKLQDILSDVGANVVLCATDHVNRFDEQALTTVIVDARAMRRLDGAPPVSTPPSCMSPLTTAVAVKDGADWALLAHRTISTVASQLGPVAGLGPDSRVLQFSPVTSPFYLVEALYPLINGGTVVIPSEGASFSEAMHDSQSNWAVITPTIASLTYPAQVPSLQTLVVAGEVGPALLTKWRGINLIHPHELAHIPVWLSLSSSPSSKVALNAFSAPHLARTWIRGPFSSAALAPADCVGEVLVEGPMIPQGYLRARKDRIVEEAPWLPGKALYRTGDLGRWTANQKLSVVRPSNTIHGHAADLVSLEQEVQAALPITQHSVLSVLHFGSSEDVALFHVDCSQQIQSAPVILAMSESLKKHFVALKASLRENIPEALLPTLFFPLNCLPLTVGRNVDRTALGKLVEALDEAALQSYRLLPSTTTTRLTANELLLVDLWAEVLRLPEPNTLRPTDSFFRLGGDSIGAMRMISVARNQGLALTMNAIFQHPVLADMAKDLRLLGQNEDKPLEPFSLLPSTTDAESLVAQAAEKCQVDATAIEDIYPCTPLQEGLMYLTSQDPTAYVIQETFKLPKSVDIPRFQAAWGAVVARSTILRTRIFVTASGNFQVLLKEPMMWSYETDLPTYLANDSAKSMTYGQPLARYGLLETPGQRYFVWTAHHAVYDGLTMPALAKQVSAEYNKEIALPETPYNRFIDYIQSVSPATATEFWTTQFATPAATFPALPTRSFQASPDQVQFHSVPVRRSLSDITMPTILRAAWAVVLAHLTDSEHVNFGVTLSGRNAAMAGIHQILGPTISTIPVHIWVRDGQVPIEFLQSVHQQAIDMIPFEHTGLQAIRRMGDQTREAVEFQNLLIIQPSGSSMDESDFLGLMPVPVEGHQSDPYPLTVECDLLDDRVDIKANFDSRLITVSEMSTILKRFAGSIERLQAVQDTTTNEDEDSKLDSMGPLSSEDFQQIMTWNSDRPQFIDSCVHEQFEEQVRLNPDAPAVSSFDVELTYGELDVLVNKLANELQARGVKPEMKIPLCFNKCSWTIVAMFAIMKVGGVSCMLNPEHPSSRIELLLNDLEANFVLCDPASSEKLLSLLPAEGVLAVDGAYLQTLPQPTPLVRQVEPHNAVFVVYTSGSTGKPKGSILEHRSMVTGLRAHCSAMGIGPGTRTFQFAAYTFDVCFEEILGSLMLGACVCVPSEAERMNELAEAMDRYQVTWTELTPTVASLLLPNSIPSLKTLALSGESLTKEVIQRWSHAVKIINTYGPSECCVSSTCNVNTSKLREPSNIGRGLGCNTWIVDPENIDRLMPIGAAGELLIEGPIVARGYLNEPEKTAAAFVGAPAWWPEAYQCGRIYRTGDLVKYNTDGTIKFIGRKDTQVKLHGQRIELGEIEHRIRNAFTDDSHQVAVEVLTPTARNGLKILTAYICESDAVSEDTENLLLPLDSGCSQRFLALQARLMSDLPRHMVPQLFIPIAHMPLSPSRKLERKGLRAVGNGLTPDQLAAYALTQVPKSAPTTETEKALVEIWSLVLGTTPSGVEDHFFHLGGDSIAAMKAVAAATNAGLPLSVADIMQTPLLGEMAAMIDRASAVQELDEAPPARFDLVPTEHLPHVLNEAAEQCAVSPGDIDDIYPCTPSQEALMALTARDETAYVSRAVYRLPINLDLDKYREAWKLLARRQAILRTRIVYSNAAAQSFQVVVNEELAWKSGDSLSTYLASDKITPMHTGQSLMRFAIVPGTTQDPQSSLVYTAHHAVYDGWSEAAMFDEAEAIYRDGLSTLPAVVPYNKFIRYLTTVDSATSDQFWRTQLDGDLPPPFPPAPPATGSALTARPNRSQSHTISLPSTSSLPYTTPTILKAAWALLLERYTLSEDVMFGHVLSGRTIPLQGVVNMMGPTIATVPVRVRLAKEETIDSFLHRINGQALNMAPFEQVGLQHIHRLLSSAKPIDVGHLFFVQPPLDSEAAGLGLEPHTVADFDFDFETYPLIVECQLGKSRSLNVDVKYDDQRIAPTQMNWLLQHFENLVHQLCEQPRTTPLSDLTLTGSADLAQLQEWMGQPVAPTTSTLHDQFRAQARARPDCCAVNAWDGKLTYNELDRLSSQFAQTLVNLNLLSGSPVGLVFDKSCWAIVALLAVLKAGGACAQLDPNHPPARLEEIATDIGMNYIMTASQYADLANSLSMRHALVVDATTASKLPSTPSMAQNLPLVDPSSPAYITFTSGSTGKPKGVLIDHRGIQTSIGAFGPVLNLTPDSRVLQFAAYTFDISYAEILAPLALGATICIISEQERLNDLSGAIQRLNPNWACLTPTVASLVEPASVPSLKTLVLSGECPTDENLRTWSGQVPNLINAYGPSEASVWCTAARFTTPNDPCNNIGYPVGCRIWIAEPDNLHRLTPLGCAGELLIEGPILSQGYVNNEQATSKAFCQDLAWMKDMQFREDFPQVYRTGDLARFMPDGSIQYHGRIDTQVKIYGRRIEPREIEHHIRLQLPGLSNMVDSVALESRNGQKVLVAYIFKGSAFMRDMEPGSIPSPLTPELREKLMGVKAALRSQLPPYMLPTLYVPLRFMPTNPSRKADRKLLSRTVNSFSDEQLHDYSLEGRTDKRAPSTPLELRVADLWAEVLNVDVASIGADDTFFGLGGDSIVAMRLASFARNNHLNLNVADLFNYPILADLAAHLTGQMPPTPDADSPPLKPEPATLPAPVLDLALHETLAPLAGVESSAIESANPTTDFQDVALIGHLSKTRWMLNWFFFDAQGPADMERLRGGCHSVVQQFDILRTIFVSHAGQFWQVVLQNMQPRFYVETTSDLDTFTQSLRDEDMTDDFQISEPFVKFVLAVHPNGQSHRLLMRLSHAQYDGVSLPTLWESLQRACQGESLLNTPSFTQFLQNTIPIDPTAARSHWRGLLTGSKETRFVENSKPALRQDVDREQVLHVTRHRVPIVSLPKNGITAATVMKSAWAVLLARLAGSSDVVFGHTIANRASSTLANVDAVVGPCLNLVPVRARLQPGQTVLDLLVALQQQQVANMPYESLGFREIIRECTDWPSWTNFSSVVQHQNIEPDRAVSLAQDTTSLYEPGFLGADLDLTDVSVLSTPIEDGYVDLDLITSSSVMSPFAAELLIGQLSDILRLWHASPVDKTPAFESGASQSLLPLSHRQAEENIRPTADPELRDLVQKAWCTVLPGDIELNNGKLDFFSAGGDLVYMAQLVSELRVHGIGNGVPLEDFVQNSSLNAMVHVLQ